MHRGKMLVLKKGTQDLYDSPMRKKLSLHAPNCGLIPCISQVCQGRFHSTEPGIVAN